MVNLDLKAFDRLMEFPEEYRDIAIEGYDRAELFEQLIALGFLKRRPDYIYNAGRQYKVLAMWRD